MRAGCEPDACTAATRTTCAPPRRGTREEGSGFVFISYYGCVGARFDFQCDATAGGAGSSSTRRRRSEQRGVQPRRGLGPARRMNGRSRTCAEITGGGRATGLHVSIDLVKRRSIAANECALLLRAVRASAASSAASRCCSRQARSAFAWLRSRATLGLVSSQLSACNEPGASRTSRMRAVDATDTQHCRAKCICHQWAMHARDQSTRHRKPRASSTGAPAMWRLEISRKMRIYSEEGCAGIIAIWS